ncbi:hypothetical protein [Psychrobacillus phage Perkons]|nr:hypothetical protein [Psychrobacillus phage Perkons]
MREKWIGEENNTSGSYHPTICSELQIRTGGYLDVIKLYRFTSRFGKEYNITDEEVIEKIEELLATYEEKDGSTKLFDYMYKLIIDKFGVVEFIVDIGHYVAKERSNGYVSGKKQIQKELRELIGLR